MPRNKVDLASAGLSRAGSPGCLMLTRWVEVKVEMSQVSRPAVIVLVALLISGISRYATRCSRFFNMRQRRGLL
jgi:hypothetical protein